MVRWHRTREITGRTLVDLAVWLASFTDSIFAQGITVRHTTLTIALAVVFSVSTLVAEENADRSPLVLKYGDGQADGRKSIAGTGKMIGFRLRDATQRLKGIRIHCSRYGYPKAPDEDIEVSLVSHDESDLVHTELVPYAKFKRGESRWTTIQFEKPIQVPTRFWLILDFNAERTKGVYVSYDTSTGGDHSKTGVPGGKSRAVKFGGDWMVQCVLTEPE